MTLDLVSSMLSSCSDVATLSVDVTTNVAVGVVTLHLSYLDHVATPSVDVVTLL